MVILLVGREYIFFYMKNPWFIIVRLGAAAISFGLPLGCYLLAFLCNDVSGCPAPSILHPSTLTLGKLKKDVGWQGFSTLVNTKAAVATIGYYTFSLILYALLPAQKVEGVELSSGGRLKYRFNGIFLSNHMTGGTTNNSLSIQLCDLHNGSTRSWHCRRRSQLPCLEVHLRKLHPAPDH